MYLGYIRGGVLGATGVVCCGIFTAVIAILGLSLVTPAIRSLFHFGPLHWNGFTLTLATAIVVLTLLELAKTFWREQLRF